MSIELPNNFQHTPRAAVNWFSETPPDGMPTLSSDTYTQRRAELLEQAGYGLDWQPAWLVEAAQRYQTERSETGAIAREMIASGSWPAIAITSHAHESSPQPASQDTAQQTAPHPEQPEPEITGSQFWEQRTIPDKQDPASTEVFAAIKEQSEEPAREGLGPRAELTDPDHHLDKLARRRKRNLTIAGIGATTLTAAASAYYFFGDKIEAFLEIRSH